MTPLSFDHWLDAHYQPSTRATYRAAIRHFTTWLEQRDGSALDFVRITRLDIAQYQGSLHDHGLAPATMNQALAALRTWFQWAIDMDLRMDNPAQEIKLVAATRACYAL